jgi:predicted nucleic acid-binding protein
MERYRLSQIDHLRQDGICFDANIWLYLFCPLGNYRIHTVIAYSKCYARILEVKLPVFVDIVIVSEVINRYLRLAHSYYCKNQGIDMDYKKYRKTEDYQKILREVYSLVKKRILPHCIIGNISYDKDMFISLLDDSDYDKDFNDHHITNLCLRHNLCLMTHDSDFKHTNIPIISENNYFWN